MVPSSMGFNPAKETATEHERRTGHEVVRTLAANGWLCENSECNSLRAEAAK